MTPSFFFKILIEDSPWFARKGEVWGVFFFSFGADLCRTFLSVAQYILSAKTNRVIGGLYCIYVIHQVMRYAPCGISPYICYS